jgi:serine/threonine-protein kinase
MVDETQRPVVFANEDALYKDGPITGELYRAAGLAPAGTTLEGHLWTSGDRIYGRFLWANVPGTGRLPVCVEIGGYDDKVGYPKREGSKPGAALSYKVIYAFPSKQWR